MAATGEKLGVELVLTRKFPETEGTTFIKLFKSELDAGIQGGMKFQW